VNNQETENTIHLAYSTQYKWQQLALEINTNYSSVNLQHCLVEYYWLIAILNRAITILQYIAAEGERVTLK